MVSAVILDVVDLGVVVPGVVVPGVVVPDAVEMSADCSWLSTCVLVVVPGVVAPQMQSPTPHVKHVAAAAATTIITPKIPSLEIPASECRPFGCVVMVFFVAGKNLPDVYVVVLVSVSVSFLIDDVIVLVEGSVVFCMVGATKLVVLAGAPCAFKTSDDELDIVKDESNKPNKKLVFIRFYKLRLVFN